MHFLLAATIWTLLSNATLADPQSTQSNSILQQADQIGTSSEVSPTERIVRDPRGPKSDPSVTRPMEGHGNNLRHPDMNAAGAPLKRYMSSDYWDNFNVPAGQTRPSPRAISNVVFEQSVNRPNPVHASDFLWQWGQFVDHDIDLTGGIDPPESYPIEVPLGDPAFDPQWAGQQQMDFNRSLYSYDNDGRRQQINEITGWIDASNVYGSDATRTEALRALDGSGRLKTGPDNLLPNNEGALANAGGNSSALFLAGDVRVNEQVALTAMHTLFMREHNRWADLLREENQGATGDEIFEYARSLVAAEIQHITYTEYLSVLLGRGAIPKYKRYKPHVDASIMNVFSTAAFRMGHSQLNSTLLRLDADGQTIAAGNLLLRDGFFAPDQVRQHGIEPLLRGLASQVCQDVDSYVIDDVRNFLFGPPGRGGFDLVSLNIQRGRDHGLPSYNDARRAMGLRPAKSFAQISSDPEVVNRLAQVYASVEDIDLWVGGISEDRYQKGLLGRLFHQIVRNQFRVLRDGDRFWYTNVLHPRDQARIENLRLSDIIRLNTDIGDEIQANVFKVQGPRRQSQVAQWQHP